MLMLSEAEVEAYLEVSERWRPVQSVYVLAAPPPGVLARGDPPPAEYYHLHPELVSMAPVDPRALSKRAFDVTGHRQRARFCLCAACLDGVHKKAPDQFSLKAGLDYGWSKRVQLPKLSVVETMALSPVRAYMCTMKISGDCTRTFHGHVIVFLHDSKATAAYLASRTRRKVPDVAEAEKSVSVQFLGKRELWERVKGRVRQMPELRASADVLFTWIKFLVETKHPCMDNADVEDTLAIRDQLGGLTDSLLDDVVIIDDEVAAEVDRMVTSDIAGVRVQGSDGPEGQPECLPPCRWGWGRWGRGGSRARGGA